MTLEQTLEASLAIALANKVHSNSGASYTASEGAARASLGHATSGGEPAPPSNLFLMPPPAPSPELPARLSPSSVNGWSDCQYRWYCKRILKLPEPARAATALGHSVHHAIAENFRQKIETREDLPPDGVAALFVNAWVDELDAGVKLQPDENAHDLCDMGVSLVRMFMDRSARQIDPAAVEEHVEGSIGGVPAHGYIDIRTTDGRIIDLKTAKTNRGVTPAHRLQVATYSMLQPEARGAQLVTLTKTKTIALHSETFEILPSDRRLAESMYSIARDQMRAGVYAPNRGSFVCSRKNCAYWGRCEDEFGGRVPA